MLQTRLRFKLMKRELEHSLLRIPVSWDFMDEQFDQSYRFRITRVLSLLIRIEVSRDGDSVGFRRRGANRNALLKESDAVKRKYKDYGVNGDARRTQMKRKVRTGRRRRRRKS
jgi:hypothetical protein